MKTISIQLYKLLFQLNNTLKQSFLILVAKIHVAYIVLELNLIIEIIGTTKKLFTTENLKKQRILVLFVSNQLVREYKVTKSYDKINNYSTHGLVTK